MPSTPRERRLHRPASKGDRRNAGAMCMYWVSRISSIGFQMAVPPLAGWWVDGRWGMSPWLMIVGAVVGFLSGMLAILKLASRFEKSAGIDPAESMPPSSSTSKSQPDGQS
ncbi:MAG: AtpZ/AtpI family protein [Planctomycetaceae bacterium]